MAIMENLQVAAIKQAYAYLDKDPDSNIPKLMDLADKLDVSNPYAKKPAADRLWACGRGCSGCETGSQAGR